VFLLFLMLTVPSVFASPTIKRPYELVEATVEGGMVSTVDPAACYDAISGELLLNCYDTLVIFDGEHVDRYLPQLATEWSNVQNSPPVHDTDTGLDFYYTYYFKIRQGVPFQNSTFGNLTAEDVEYCFERAMIIDFVGGPQWMLYEPLLNGAGHAYVNGSDMDPINNVTERILVGKMIDHAVESNGTHIWFNLAFPGAYAPFVQILAEPWSSIYSKVWANSLGRNNWNGAWGDYTNWTAYTSPAVAPFDDPTPAVMGTGPFKLAHLDQTQHYWDADRFTGYWRGWPVDWPASGMSRPAGYVDHLKVTWAYDWGARYTMFLNGDVDFCAVPWQYADSMVVGQPGIRCIRPLPTLAVEAFFFQFDINQSSSYGPILPAGTFNESGVPSDFFGNVSWGVHVRKAFAFAADYDYFIQSAYLGKAVRPATAVIPVLPYYDSSIKGYSLDLTQAEEELKQVPGLWDTGFSLQLPCLISGTGRTQFVPETIAEHLSSLNPKFHFRIVPLPWSEYLAARVNRQLPTSMLGWLGDYPDPHNFVYPFYHSHGDLNSRSGYSNPTMDTLIETGMKQPDGPERAVTYSAIQQLAIDDCACVALDSATGHHFERDWVVGSYYNPVWNSLFGGEYFANIWKWYYVPQALNDTSTQPTSNFLSFDVNYDGRVNMYDIGVVASNFGAYYGPPMQTRWMFRCDLNNDRKTDMRDIGSVAKHFGETSAVWGPS
jgi:peptide/nickel transport system substrate-binding protein